jgi:hypothetical protein
MLTSSQIEALRLLLTDHYKGHGGMTTLCDMALAYLDLRAKVDGATRIFVWNDNEATVVEQPDPSAPYIRYADVAGDMFALVDTETGAELAPDDALAPGKKYAVRIRGLADGPSAVITDNAGASKVTGGITELPNYQWTKLGDA